MGAKVEVEITLGFEKRGEEREAREGRPGGEEEDGGRDDIVGEGPEEGESCGEKETVESRE